MAYSNGKQFTFNAGYSNFTSFTKQRPQVDPFYKNTLDTLNFYQIAQNANASIIYSFGNTIAKQNIVVTGNYLVSSQAQGQFKSITEINSSNTNLVPASAINSNISYNAQFVKSKISSSFIFNLNKIYASNSEIIYLGPGINVGKSFLDRKLNLSVGSTFNSSFTNNVKGNEFLSNRLSFTFNPKLKNEKIGRMSVTVSAIYLQKIQSSSVKGFSEFTGNFSLNYSF
jgi:hypothetical protein